MREANEPERRSISVGEREAAAGALGRITVDILVQYRIALVE